MTVEEVLSNPVLIGSDLELIIGNTIYRGPIKKVSEKENLLVFELEWWAVSLGGSKGWMVCNRQDCFIPKEAFKTLRWKDVQLHFLIPDVGTVTIFYGKHTKLDPAKVQGLQ